MSVARHWSQHGEDDIVDSLLQQIGISNGFFVEFGAWDGKHLSNTYSLYERGWSGCYIEGNPSRVADLTRNCPEERVIKVCSFVEASGPCSLDNILADHNVLEVDLLSIDIDGDDYLVWQSVNHYLPKILVIEYNSTIPFDTRYVNPQHQSHGNSALSIKELSEEKGYILAAGTPTNLIFVTAKLANNYRIPEITLQTIQDTNRGPRYFFGYDGTLVRIPSALRAEGIEEILVIPWTGCPVPQPLPRIFRRFCDPGSTRYTIRRFYGAWWSFVRSPSQFWKAVLLARNIDKDQKSDGSL